MTSGRGFLAHPFASVTVAAMVLLQAVPAQSALRSCGAQAFDSALHDIAVFGS